MNRVEAPLSRLLLFLPPSVPPLECAALLLLALHLARSLSRTTPAFVSFWPNALRFLSLGIAAYAAVLGQRWEAALELGSDPDPGSPDIHSNHLNLIADMMRIPHTASISIVALLHLVCAFLALSASTGSGSEALLRWIATVREQCHQLDRALFGLDQDVLPSKSIEVESASRYSAVVRDFELDPAFNELDSEGQLMYRQQRVEETSMLMHLSSHKGIGCIVTIYCVYPLLALAFTAKRSDPLNMVTTLSLVSVKLSIFSPLPQFVVLFTEVLDPSHFLVHALELLGGASSYSFLSASFVVPYTLFASMSLQLLNRLMDLCCAYSSPSEMDMGRALRFYTALAVFVQFLAWFICFLLIRCLRRILSQQRLEREQINAAEDHLDTHSALNTKNQDSETGNIDLAPPSACFIEESDWILMVEPRVRSWAIQQHLVPSDAWRVTRFMAVLSSISSLIFWTTGSVSACEGRKIWLTNLSLPCIIRHRSESESDKRRVVYGDETHKLRGKSSFKSAQSLPNSVVVSIQEEAMEDATELSTAAFAAIVASDVREWSETQYSDAIWVSRWKFSNDASPAHHQAALEHIVDNFKNHGQLAAELDFKKYPSAWASVLALAWSFAFQVPGYGSAALSSQTSPMNETKIADLFDVAILKPLHSIPTTQKTHVIVVSGFDHESGFTALSSLIPHLAKLPFGFKFVF
ncbi:hypothetical protein BC830DRAFT_1083393, partial [Chytriomyces sp. MP71]